MLVVLIYISVTGVSRKNYEVPHKKDEIKKIFSKTLNNSNSTRYKQQLIKCYKQAKQFKNGTKLIKLIDILDSGRKPRPGKSIIFHETGCSLNGLLELGKRQICSIESAAKNNPNFDIFVLFASPRYVNPDSMQKELQRLKLNYDNIFFRNNDIWRYANISQTTSFLESELLFESGYFPVHLSDFLRLISIWKWGSIYMDSDIILKRTFEDISPNFAGLEETGFNLNNGLISLSADANGTQIGSAFIADFVKSFDPKGWATNGPRLISRVLKSLCNESNLENLSSGKCLGFTVYPKETFWAVDVYKVRDFFNPEHFEEMKNITRNSYSIHIFNHVSKNIISKIGSKSLYDLTTKEQCPVTYRNAGKFL